MDRDSLLERLEHEPFRPFVVITSAGDRYEVRSPDMAWLLKSRLLIALPPTSGDLPDRTADLALLHVVGVEELHTV
jgi:hypothetical protein